MVESAPSGWWYTTKLPGDKQLITFYTDDDLPSARLARTGEGFKQLLRETQISKAKKLEVQTLQIRS